MKRSSSTAVNVHSASRRRLLQQMAIGAVGGISGALQRALAADLAAGGAGIRSVRGGTVLVMALRQWSARRYIQAPQ